MNLIPKRFLIALLSSVFLCSPPFSQANELKWSDSVLPVELTSSEKRHELQIQAEYSTKNLKKRQFKKGDRIGIIGAGITGLAIARSLITQGVPGKSITIFEERLAPGGKARGLFLPDDTGKKRHYELGAAVVIPGRYQLIEDLIQHHQLTTRPLDPPVFIDILSGTVLPDPTESERAELKAQAGYYLNLFKTNPSWNFLSRPDGYRRVPAELETSWYDFLSVHGPYIDKLNQRLAVALGGSGFLMAQNPPFSAQIIRFINPSFLVPILTPGRGSRLFNELNGPCLPDQKFIEKSDTNGFQCLWMREAYELNAQYGVNFEFGTRVSHIKRGQKVRLTYLRQIKDSETPDTQIGHSKVSFKHGGHKKFDHIFYTGDLRYLTSSPWEPADSSNRDRGILSDATQGEKKLYGSIEVYPYKSYMVRLKNFPAQEKEALIALMPQVLTGERDQPVLMMRTYKDTDVFQIWGYGSRDEKSTQSFLTKFKSDMARIGVDFHPQRDLLISSEWDYFPHATPKNGQNLKSFFDEVMARQGVGGLWMSSEAIGFGLTIESYEQGKAFAEWFTKGVL